MKDKDSIRRNFLKYTKKAYEVIPKIEKPRILDIGCGSGILTIELAKISGGEVIGIDIDNVLLDILRERIKSEKLSDRVRVISCSMSDIGFPCKSFDIIWAEGSINFIGFERGLRYWYRFIRPGGYLVVHDEIGDIEEKQNSITSSSYNLLEYFTLSENTWWSEYFEPLNELVEQIKANQPTNSKNHVVLQDAQKELNYFRQNPEKCASVFFIMRKQ